MIGASWNSTLRKNGIGSIEPRRQPDAAGHGIQFRDADAGFRQQNVGPDDARHVVFERGRTLERDEFRRFAEIEPAGDPFRLLALGAFAVKQIDRAIELQQHPPQRFDFPGQFFVERKRYRRNPPVQPGEQTARRERVADEFGLVGGVHNFWPRPKKFSIKPAADKRAIYFRSS